MTRATSTVLDVTVFLLLVGAAATAVVDTAAVTPPETGTPAADRAELLATTTASVDYALDPAGDPPEWVTTPSLRHRRTAHGTVAELLGEAAMSAVAVDERRLSIASEGFERGVVNATRDRLDGRGQRTAVRARWEPYRGAPVGGVVRVGPTPPPAVDVRTATLTVGSPMADAREQALSAADVAGHRGVAGVVASTVVTGLFPPDRTRIALRGDYPTDALVANRYRRFGAAAGESVRPSERTSPEALNRRLRERLTTMLAADLRARFDSPTAAARSVRTGTVSITVRTWSA
ncbi:DUF7284 family protein [Haloarcula marina]|uniref:DUF7284 family protein n=1 Tax=Haloarcula marina TaxID=2961574 RepID=UPI0020B6C4F0|nr:hypothetical protein [Halomicroarcula marina]